MTNPLPSQVLPPFTDVRQSTVKPFEKTSHVETIDPGPFDITYPEFFFPILFAYRLPDKSDAVYSQVAKRIKESLSKVLIPFFTFAGRWVASPPGSPGRQLLCNDEGVPFIEARMDAALDSVVQASAAFQPVPELHGHKYVGMDSAQFMQQLPADGAPCLFVQVTRFNCGGLVVAVTFHHMNADGEAFFRFMRAWSDLARTNQTAVKVDNNRAQLKLPCPTADMLDPSVMAQGYMQMQREFGYWGMRCFEVGASMIQGLKEEARQDGAGGGYVSTGDCIIAHLMKSVQRLSTSFLAREAVVSRVVEGRKRFFDIPVPDVVANVTTVMLPPDIPKSELVEMPLVSVASRFRKQLEETKTEDWLGYPVMGKFVETVGIKRVTNVSVTSWFNFGMYGIDFGFGSPYFAVGPNSHAGVDSLAVAVVYPPIPSSGSSVATVNISASPDVLEALGSDPQFLEFFLVHSDCE